jgi:hypothetical protein
MNLMLVALSWLMFEYSLLLGCLAIGALVAPVFMMAAQSSLDRRFAKKAVRQPPLDKSKAHLWFANIQKLGDTKPLEYSDRFRDRNGKK